MNGSITTDNKATILYGSVFSFSYHLSLYHDINLDVKGKACHSGGQSRTLYDFGWIDNNNLPRLDTLVRFAQDVPMPC